MSGRDSVRKLEATRENVCNRETEREADRQKWK